jgi:hypothetical protein
MAAFARVNALIATQTDASTHLVLAQTLHRLLLCLLKPLIRTRHLNPAMFNEPEPETLQDRGGEHTIYPIYIIPGLTEGSLDTQEQGIEVLLGYNLGRNVTRQVFKDVEIPCMGKSLTPEILELPID